MSTESLTAQKTNPEYAILGVLVIFMALALLYSVTIPIDSALAGKADGYIMSFTWSYGQTPVNLTHGEARGRQLLIVHLAGQRFNDYSSLKRTVFAAFRTFPKPASRMADFTCALATGES